MFFLRYDEYIYEYIMMWRLPKMEVPQNHGFQYQNGLVTWMIWGYTYFRKPRGIQCNGDGMTG